MSTEPNVSEEYELSSRPLSVEPLRFGRPAEDQLAEREQVYDRQREARMTPVATIARAFHDAYEAQADFYGWEPNKETRVGWDDLPTANKALVLSVVDTLLTTGVIVPGPRVPS